MQQSLSNFELVEQKSRFIGLAFALSDPLLFKNIKSSIKKEHPSASHITYAYKCGGVCSASDDREPSHTAGSQILSEIQKSGKDNIAVVVVRYFGGKKLGKKNLSAAYRECAAQTIAKNKGIKCQQ